MRISRLLALSFLLVPSTALAYPTRAEPVRRGVITPRVERAYRAPVVSRSYAAPRAYGHSRGYVAPYARGYPVRARVRVAPPPVRYEYRSYAPSRRHVWAPGYWGWQGSRHAWVSGAWRLPPAAGLVWVAPRWVNQGSDWAFYDGRWAQPTEVGYLPTDSGYGAPYGADPYFPATDIDVAPPPLPYEAQPPPPAPGYLWTPGYWGWNGSQHVWMGGRYEAPRVGWTWRPHRWVQVGFRWRLLAGGWISL